MHFPQSHFSFPPSVFPSRDVLGRKPSGRLATRRLSCGAGLPGDRRSRAKISYFRLHRGWIVNQGLVFPLKATKVLI